MSENVVKLSANTKRSPDTGIAFTTMIIAAISVLGSAAVSTLIVGIYVGQFKSSLDSLTKEQEMDRTDFKRRLENLTDLVSVLNANLAGVSSGLTGLKSALDIERQDRITDNARRLRN